MLNEFIDGIVEIVIKLNKTIANYWYTSSGQFNAKQRSIWSINAFGIYNGIWNEKLKVISVMLKSIQYKSINQSCILCKKYSFSLSVQFFGGNVPLSLHLFR